MYTSVLARIGSKWLSLLFGKLMEHFLNQTALLSTGNDDQGVRQKMKDSTITVKGVWLGIRSGRRHNRYLSSHAVPRSFLVLSNSARNFFWLQSFAKALRINLYYSPRVVWAIVTFLASKA
ncbi:hypothetical protein Tco_1004900 [Tanacetum coccineum]|uniref:Uncharacterized protein n=1 Tax=Tanacetum coccineum TaxID=301880 RepID=A0ABQ5FDM7_9ASTR